jgi:hypothetical protein
MLNLGYWSNNQPSFCQLGISLSFSHAVECIFFQSFGISFLAINDSPQQHL